MNDQKDNFNLAPKRWIMTAGFVAGYLVFCAFFVKEEGFDLRDAVFGFALYCGLVGGALLLPWVVLPIIAREERRGKRVWFAALAGLLPTTFTLVVITCQRTGWDAPARVLSATGAAFATWLFPALAVLAYTAVRGTNEAGREARKANPLLVWGASIVSLLIAGFFTMFFSVVGGWVTRTESPNAEQVAHAREFLLIDPELEIEPVAYYLKNGMDCMVRFKFLAKTRDPARIFEAAQVDASVFQGDFEFRPGEATHNEPWWDIKSRPLQGGRFRSPNGQTVEAGYAKNEDGTLTVYVWRHEGPLDGP